MNIRFGLVFSVVALVAMGAGCPPATPANTNQVTTPTPTVTPPVEIPSDGASLGMVVDPADTVQAFLDSYLGEYPDSAREIESNTVVAPAMQERLAAGSPYDLFLCNQEAWEMFSVGQAEFAPLDPDALTANPTSATMEVEFSNPSVGDSATVVYTVEASDQYGWQISNVSCSDLE
jgi:ABC-type glycerol-3-phosphate transport system substrate-binding protein